MNPTMDPERYRNMQALAERLGLPHIDIELLNLSLCHSSYANERESIESYGNERLEFLGDAIVGYAVTEFLYTHHPQLREGQLSKIKSVVVSKRILAQRSIALNLGEHLLLGKGEELTGGRTRVSILGNLFESVVGAIHLALGIDVASRFVIDQLYHEIERTVRGESIIDHKSILQEHIQKQYGVLPSYRVVSAEGPDHDKDFIVEVYVRNERVAEGSGKSKKRAEKNAASNALTKLGVEVDAG